MRPVGDVLVAAEERRVEDRRPELADASADVRTVVTAVRLATDDGRGRNVPVGQCALTHPIVDRERTTGQDHRAVDFVGHQLDVRDPVFAGGVFRRELGDQTQIPVRFGLFGGEPRLVALKDREITCAAAERSLEDGGLHAGQIEESAVARWDHAHDVVGQVDVVPRAHRGEFESRAQRVDGVGHRIVIEGHFERDRVAAELRANGRLQILLGERDRKADRVVREGDRVVDDFADLGGDCVHFGVGEEGLGGDHGKLGRDPREVDQGGYHVLV